MRVVARSTDFLLGHRPADALELHGLLPIRLLLELYLLFQKLGDLGIFHKLLELIYRNIVWVAVGQLRDHLRLSTLTLLLATTLLQVVLASILGCVAVRLVLPLGHLLI